MGGLSPFPVSVTSQPFPPPCPASVWAPCLEGQSLGLGFQQPGGFLGQDNSITASESGSSQWSWEWRVGCGSRKQRREDREGLEPLPPGSVQCSFISGVTSSRKSFLLSLSGLPKCPMLCPLLHLHFLHSPLSSLLLFGLPQCAVSIWRPRSMWCIHCVLSIGARHTVGAW